MVPTCEGREALFRVAKRTSSPLMMWRDWECKCDDTTFDSILPVTRGPSMRGGGEVVSIDFHVYHRK